MPENRNSSHPPIGVLLKDWRRLRRMSQLDLALEADVSPRHVAFLETGRARASREMVLTLASALDVPLREQNTLLLAAGYAPVHRETNLDAPELGPVRTALEAILRQQEPFPAVVMDRHWNLLTANEAAGHFFEFLLGEATSAGPANVIRLMFDPEGLRPYVANWERAAEALVRRLHREAVGGFLDDALTALLEEALAYPDVPGQWRTPGLETPLVPVVPIAFEKDGRRFDYFSAVTTLGTAQDVTLEEIRVECFFPMNVETERRARELAVSDDRARVSVARS